MSAAVNTVVRATPLPGTQATPKPQPVGPQPVPPGNGDGRQPPPAPLPPAHRFNNPSGFPQDKPPRPSGVYKLIITAGQTQQIDEGGDQITIISASAPVTIQPAPGGRVEKYYPGDVVKFSAPFKFLRVTNNNTAAALFVTVWVGFETRKGYTPMLVPTGPTEGHATIGITGVPQSIFVGDVFFRKIWLYGYQSISGATIVNNGANINLGKSKNYQPDILAPGQYLPYEFPDGQWFNLSAIYITGAAGDGVFYTLT